MALMKIDEYYPDYTQDVFGGNDLINYSVYADNGDDKVGSVENILVDEETGRFRYLIVDTGFWVFGKKVLVPVGLARLDDDDKRVYVARLTKQQVEDLPEFTENLAINQDYEERVRGVYRPLVGTTAAVPDYNYGIYDYLQEPYFYDMYGLGYPTFGAYEQRLLARRER
ncbi:MAG: PRC-barrel domain-containing protein [Scytonema sp. PMC 1069.18]|nr:PRC-barrel domain-containing protein [Scytonema sp. PMC 1069.18]MEC4884133.1 PRC-barrel domain-containing protein [Scytonema sp. PMC 1070.18]